MIKLQQRGFTLVELSIVLVILGLLIGGVLTGQSLIRAAELRSVSTQYARYYTAVQTFRDKYFALPGDMTNATSYWGAVDGSTGRTAACATTPSTNALTCNGDGDGRIWAPSPTAESFRFWQHLANAGLIEGSYNGITAGSYEFAATSVNSPTGKMSGSLWFIYARGVVAGQPDLFDADYGSALQMGKIRANFDPVNSIMKAEDLYNIDMKMDDGKPAIGRMRSLGTITDCTDGTNSTSFGASYKLTNSAIACSPIFPIAI